MNQNEVDAALANLLTSSLKFINLSNNYYEIKTNHKIISHYHNQHLPTKY